MFVAVGVALRPGAALYFPFWGDELMLIQNYLGRGFGDLLKPLTMQQVAPIGYVAAELTAIKLFGFSEWSLRLFAIVTSIAGLFVFRDLAGRVLGKVPMVLAVGVLAVSYYPIRHAAECKPYGSDLTAALVLVWLAVRWLQNPEKRRWLWARRGGPRGDRVFESDDLRRGRGGTRAGAAGMASRDQQAWGAFALYNLLVAIVFLAMLKSITAAQYAATHEFMHQYWADGFLPGVRWRSVSWLASIQPARSSLIRWG